MLMESTCLALNLALALKSPKLLLKSLVGMHSNGILNQNSENETYRGIKIQMIE